MRTIWNAGSGVSCKRALDSGVFLERGGWRAMSNPGDVVIEPFAGNGTAVIACEQTHRKWRAMG